MSLLREKPRQVCARRWRSTEKGLELTLEGLMSRLRSSFNVQSSQHVGEAAQGTRGVWEAGIWDRR